MQTAYKTNIIKIMDKLKVVNDWLLGQIHREIEWQSQLHYQNIATCMLSFFDHKIICLILEYCHGGSLYGLYAKEGFFTEETLTKYIVSLAKA
jgi:serine/threonine protein kinase